MKNILFGLFIFVAIREGAAQITILPVFGDKPITEETWFVTKNNDSIQFDNIRFYLSNIQFETIDNQLVSDKEKAHLIDVFEPNSLKIDFNNIYFNNIDFNTIKTLRFNIGIDSLTNVSGALGGDLDPQKGMYWAWQSGYINLKIEGRSPQCKNRKNVFQYHIGGYLQPFYAMRNVELQLKNRQNSVEERNPDTSGQGVILKMDISKFFENISISTQNSIMMPCKEAMQLADYSTSMFPIYVPKK
jgi:hypothetical protein